MLFENLTTFLITQVYNIIFCSLSPPCYRSPEMKKPDTFNARLSKFLFIFICSLSLSTFITWAESAELTPVPEVFYTLILPAYSISPCLLFLCYQYSLKQSWHCIKYIFLHLTTFIISLRGCPKSLKAMVKASIEL